MCFFINLMYKESNIKRFVFKLRENIFTTMNSFKSDPDRLKWSKFFVAIPKDFRSNN